MSVSHTLFLLIYLKLDFMPKQVVFIVDRLGNVITLCTSTIFENFLVYAVEMMPMVWPIEKKESTGGSKAD